MKISAYLEGNTGGSPGMVQCKAIMDDHDTFNRTCFLMAINCNFDIDCEIKNRMKGLSHTRNPGNVVHSTKVLIYVWFRISEQPMIRTGVCRHQSAWSKFM